MEIERKRYACGVICLFTSGGASSKSPEKLFEGLDPSQYCFALIYFSKSGCTPATVIEMMNRAAPDLPYAACSTAGEITPAGLVDGELVAILFPKDIFHIQSCEVAKPDETNMEAIISQVAELKSDFVNSEEVMAGHTSFAMCLMDGMSYKEEAITAAMHWGLDDIPLLGGSAGDDMNFSETTLISNGQLIHSNAVLIMFSSHLPQQIFKTENFVPTPQKLVVTRSDPDLRIVHELNGAVAAEVYADVIGADPRNLTPQSFASHPLVVRVGGEYYCRSIQKVNDDNSLTFFCAIDDGVVLTVAEPTGMARTTQNKMEDIQRNLGQIDFILGFDCVLRQIDARNRQITHKISSIYQENNVIGFNTYGEQYRSMHLNQTLTGIAFGIPQNQD